MHFINIFNLHMKPAFSELGREFLVAAVCGWVVIFFSTCIPESYSKKKKKRMQINMCISSDKRAQTAVRSHRIIE